MTLYFLVRSGTNIRALSRDNEPVVAQHDALPTLIDFFNGITRREMTLPKYVEMPVDDYYKTFAAQTRLAKQRAEADLLLAYPNEVPK